MLRCYDGAPGTWANNVRASSFQFVFGYFSSRRSMVERHWSYFANFCCVYASQ